MELKLCPFVCRTEVIPLLIVPYGIETNLLTFFEVLSPLLIVPYGIETLY